MVDPATLVWQIALLTAVAITGVRYFLERHPENRDVFLVFAPLLGLLVADWADALLGGASGQVVEYVALGLILTHPYAMLRVVDHLRPVPEGPKRTALLGLGASLGVLIAAPFPRPDALTMALAGYFVAVEGYAAFLLALGSRSASGANRARLRFASVGASLVGMAVFVAFNWDLLPGDPALRIAGLQTLVLAGFVSLLAGFAPPRSLTRAWDLRTAHEIKQSGGKARTLSERVEASIERFIQVVEQVAQPEGWVFVVKRGEDLDMRFEPEGLNVPEDPLESGSTLRDCLETGEIQRTREAMKASGWEGRLATSLRTSSMMAIPIRAGLEGSDVQGAILLFLPELPLFPSQRESFLDIHSEELAQALEMESLAQEREREHVESLEREKQALEEADRMKAEFLSTMSHEIRTPVNAILGSTDLLRDVVDEEKQDHLETIERSGDHLLAVLNDILDLSRIEADEVRIQARPVQVREFVESCTDLVAEAASSKGLDLSHQIGPDVPDAVRMDTGRVRQILVNLLTNAVKFTDEGHVTLHVDAREDDDVSVLEFTVEDTGPGIPFEDQDAIFEPFHQAEPSTTREHEGTGLGLAICRRLVDLMEGSISVDSRPGHGSSFHVSIPVQTTAVIEDVGEAETGFLEETEALVLFPDEELRTSVRDRLESWGADAQAVDDLEELPSEGPEGRSRVAILDSETYETMREADVDLAATEVIVLTDGSGETLEDRPDVETLDKPFRFSDLYRALKRLLSPGVGIARRTPPARRAATEGEELEILVVEDNEVNRRVVSSLLEKLGYDPATASSGEKALRILQAQPFDLVLLDIRMPEMDGFEVAERIRSQLPENGQPRIVALTAHVEDHYRRRSRQAGMDGFLAKPVREQELTDEIRQTVEGGGPRAPLGPDGERPGSPSSPPQIVDEVYLASLREKLGPQVFEDLLESFEDEARQTVEELARARDEADAEGIETQAHSLRGLAQNVGARGLARQAAELEEQAGEEGETDGGVSELRSLLDRTLEELWTSS